MGLDALAEAHDGPDHAGGGVVHPVVGPVQRRGGGRFQLLESRSKWNEKAQIRINMESNKNYNKMESFR